MSATVTLQVVSGPLHGAEFVYQAPALCSVGRGRDCGLQIPNGEAYRTVSRHHCLLEITPPEVWVADLGSLNGTFVNGHPIGHRDPEAGAERPITPEHLLHDGDELRVGEVVFRVGVRVEEPAEQRVPCETLC
jgi:pSer/pThr/pTyr-binding forkhead associated (FHA) protein